VDTLTQWLAPRGSVNRVLKGKLPVGDGVYASDSKVARKSADADEYAIAKVLKLSRLLTDAHT
jgi:hypothetical protein